MREANLLKLERVFNEAIKTKAKYIAVVIKTRGRKAEEIVINTRDGFDERLAYYMNAYDYDLTLKSFPVVKITVIVYGNSFEEIHSKLLADPFYRE